MQNIIDESYFWGDLKIGGLYVQNTTIQGQANAARTQELTQYIAKYQKEYLTKMFGKTVAENMPDELTAMLYDAELRTSPIANYVYCKWVYGNATQSTASGEKALNKTRSLNASPYAKTVAAWNEMVSFNLELQKGLYEAGTIGVYDYETDILANISTTADIFNYTNRYGIW